MSGESPLPPNARLAVADSFRTRSTHIDGRTETTARGWHHHQHRFITSVTEITLGTPHAPTTTEIAAFLAQTTQQISQAGTGFPRLELWHTPTAEPIWQLRVALRPLPSLGESLHTALAAGVPLIHPAHKGPNIGTFSRLNSALGCEALLVAPDGTITEGATTSVLWWEDGTLCRSAATARVASVTELLVCEYAAAAGYPVASRTFTAETLRTHTAWAVNALHGIRPITHLDGEQLTAPKRSALLQQFREALDLTWQSFR